MQSHLNINGGLDLLISHFNDIKIWDNLDEWLGKRNPRAEYSYGDVIQTWVMNIIGGSRRLQHTNYNKSTLNDHPKFKKGISVDTISRTLRELATENTYYSKVSQKSPVHKIIVNPVKKLGLNEVNDNPKMNYALVDAAMKLGLLGKNEAYELDIDATIVPSKISDTRTHYKGNGKGYCPMVVVLGGFPVFIEGRNGNSSPMFRVKHVMENAIDLIESKGLKIKFVRIDAAGSSQIVTDYLCSKKIPFFIRAHERTRPNEINPWVTSKLNPELETTFHQIMLGDNPLTLIDYTRNDIDEEGNKRVWGILTNTENVNPDEIIELYNQRGSIEQRFADLKEMGWKYMIHRKLKYNMVHMQITMLAYMMFIYAKKWLSGKLSFIKENIKPKTFIKIFIQVITRWVDGKLEFLTRQNEFEPILKYIT